MIRAERRHQAERLKKYRKNYWGFGRFSCRHEEMDERRLGIVVKTPKPCSCWMCANQRQYYGKSFQEKRQEIIE